MTIPDALVPWLQLITAAIALATAAGYAWRKWGRPTVAWFRALGDAVERELMPNGGESIKDRVAEIHVRLKDGDAVFDDHERRIKALEDGD